MAKQNLTTQLFYDNTWNDAPVRVSDAITISRGKSDEQSEPTPSTVGLTLDNRTAKYNPKNPTSSLYGKIGPNTPIRVQLPVTPFTITEDFEDDQFNFTFTQSGNRAWARNSGFQHSGSYAFRAGPFSTGDSTTLAIRVPPGATQLSFWAANSGALETFQISFDGVNTTAIGVGGSFAQVTYDVTDVSVVTITAVESTVGSSFGYIDDLTFTISRDVRFTGEVSAYNPDRTINFSTTGKGDAWTGVEASGILRRLGQGAEPLISPIKRAVLDANNTGHVAAYWPCEDGSGATQVASGLPGGNPMTIDGGGTIGFADSTAFGGSAPLLVLGANTNLHGKVPATPDTTGSCYFRTLLGVPSAGYTNGLNIINLYMANGTIERIGFRWDTTLNGAIWIDAMGPSGTQLDTWGISFAASGGLNGKNILLSLTLDQTGSDIFLEIDIVFLNADGTVNSLGAGHTFTGLTLGRCREFTIGAFGQMDGTTLGHVVIANIEDVLHIDTDSTISLLQGYKGETADVRIVRLCAENNIPVAIVGAAGSGALMGSQFTDTLLNLLADCERTDGGILYEPRGYNGLFYRTLNTLYRQTPVLALDWTLFHVAPPFSPVIDDRFTRNDVTAKRSNGSSARAVQSSGPRNINKPEVDPEGVGRYATEIEVNPASDDALADLASWYLHLGTIDEIRYPQVTVDLVASPALATTAAKVDIGDVITISNLPPDISPDMASLVVVSYTEVIGSHTRTVTFNCAPASAYDVAIYDTDRYESSVAPQLSVAVNATDTSWTVLVGSGDTAWTTTPAHFPFDMIWEGERVRVTNISGLFSLSLQTFTVQRSINGAVKSHGVGAKGRLFREPVYAKGGGS